MRKNSTTTFIDRANQVHNNTYDYSNTEYDNISTKVQINCLLHGVFFQEPKVHLRGSGCPICSKERQTQNKFLSEDEVITRAKQVHGEKYDYSAVKYTKMSERVIIKCPDHGIFLQSPNKHINAKQGCPMCGASISGVRLSNQQFIEKSQKIYEGKIDYSLVNYVNNTTPITLICNQHGEYEQLPAYHLANKIDCPICVNDSRRSGNRAGLYSHKFFDDHPELKNKPAILYLVKLRGNNEIFTKIGITTQLIQKRFPNMQNGNYVVEIEKAITTTLYRAFLTEQRFIRLYSRFKYIPKETFNGHSECFRLKSID